MREPSALRASPGIRGMCSAYVKGAPPGSPLQLAEDAGTVGRLAAALLPNPYHELRMKGGAPRANSPGPYLYAEDAGFEPARALTQPAFQASAIGL